MARAEPLPLMLAAFLLVGDCAAWAYALLEMARHAA
jgi:hypothetical protein